MANIIRWIKKIQSHGVPGELPPPRAALFVFKIPLGVVFFNNSDWDGVKAQWGNFNINKEIENHPYGVLLWY